MDEWIGRIHQAVEENGQLDNTIIIHTADHGLAVGQHGLMGKQNLYQHSVHVPLIIAGPDIPSGRVSDALCYQHALHPTLVSLGGAKGESSPFQSLLPVLHGAAGRTHVGSSFRNLQRSVRDSRYQLIEYRVSGDSFSYYPLTLMHSPLAPTPDGASGNGLLADNIAYMDKIVGRLLAGLGKLGLREDTLVVFTGDNGNGLSGKIDGKTIDGNKGSLREGGSRVPLMQRLPEQNCRRFWMS